MKSYKFKSFIDENDEIMVTFDFSPPEKQTRHHPGFPGEIELTGVYHPISSRNLLGKLCSEAIARIEQEATEFMEET